MSATGSCPICYETYSTDSPNTLPRKTKCDHIMCSSCLRSEFSNGLFICPECGTEVTARTVDNFSVILSISAASNSAVKETNPITIDTIPSAPKSAISAFISNHGGSKAGNQSPPKEDKQHTPRGQCKHKDCTNKAAGTHGFCLNHSTSLHTNVVAATEIAKDLANTSLHLFSVKGNNVEVNNEVSAGWDRIEPLEIIKRFEKQNQMEFGEAMTLITKAKEVMGKEPNILRLNSPVIAVGDIHGQFFDLLNIFAVGGEPWIENNNNVYLFLGDYVDRGSFSCEVILILLALKVAYPDRYVCRYLKCSLFLLYDNYCYYVFIIIEYIY
jgi:hypothetical protein